MADVAIASGTSGSKEDAASLIKSFAGCHGAKNTIFDWP
jgi:hypothetical protein